MSIRRSLDPEEQALWNKVVQTVTPLHPHEIAPPTSAAQKADKATKKTKVKNGQMPVKPVVMTKKPGRLATAGVATAAKQEKHNLDSHWDRRFRKGVIEPDVSIDLHGTGLAGAYQRLDSALEQAVHQRLRVILLVTGKQRSHDRASGQGRGAIAAVVRDWLAASRHASHIAAVRNAHPRHGGAGALYIILKRR